MPGQEGSEFAPQRDEAESALERVTRDGSVIGSSSSRRLSDSSHLRHSGEEGGLLNQDEEDDDDDNHAFAESIRRDTGELLILKDGFSKFDSVHILCDSSFMGSSVAFTYGTEIQLFDFINLFFMLLVTVISTEPPVKFQN